MRDRPVLYTEDTSLRQVQTPATAQVLFTLTLLNKHELKFFGPFGSGLNPHRSPISFYLASILVLFLAHPAVSRRISRHELDLELETREFLEQVSLHARSRVVAMRVSVAQGACIAASSGRVSSSISCVCASVRRATDS